MKNLKRITFILIGFHIISYLMIGEVMLESEILDDFESFNNRRLLNKYNKDVSEKFYFASCGDEFFRDKNRLFEFMEKINPDKYDPTKNKKYFQRIEVLNANYDLSKLLNEETTEDENVTCVIFKVCQVRRIPFIYTKVSRDEVFSTHTDFHAMFYNDQTKQYDVYYIWFLFKWVKIMTTNEGDH